MIKRAAKRQTKRTLILFDMVFSDLTVYLHSCYTTKTGLCQYDFANYKRFGVVVDILLKPCYNNTLRKEVCEMNRLGERGKRYVVFLCVVLVLFHVFVLFLPHTDDCVEVDCFVCALIGTSRKLLVGVVLSLMLYHLTDFLNRAVGVCRKRIRIDGTTPISLKVKLLN